MKEPTHESARALVRRASGPLTSHLDPLYRLIDRAAVPSERHLHQGAAPAGLRPLACKAPGGVAWEKRRSSDIRTAVVSDTDAFVSLLDRSNGRRLHSCSSSCALEVCVTPPVLRLRRLTIWSLTSRSIFRISKGSQAQRSIATAGSHGSFFTIALAAVQSIYARCAPDDAIAFVKRESQRLQAPALKCVTNALRSLLRYAQFRGEVPAALAAAVPSVSAWSTTPALPKAISPEHARLAIDSCDLRTRVGLRDRAVLLLLARLGLRAHEIVALQLSDLDWRRGHIRLRGKGGREQLLPLPTEVGAAIAAYLQKGRPTSHDRHVFLRSQAPIRGLIVGSDVIGSIVRSALE